MTVTMTYKERLQADYRRIRADTKAGNLPLPERLQQIEEATKRYALAHAEEYDKAVAQAIADGRSPGTVVIPFKDDRLLHNMADLCMDEYLRWSHPDKMSIVEYPVMSDSQHRTRRIREILTDFSDNADDEKQEYHSHLIQGLAVDGKNYSNPIRRTRSIWELIQMERK